MIDFRYHLVSLVSVFLALAVGIVLGAGPLKGEIGDELNRQVHSLAAENADLRTQVKTAQGAAGNRDAFTLAVLPQLTAGQLTGGRVVLVTLPGADPDAVAPLSEALKAAGATVTGRVGVDQNWVDPGHATDRDGVAATFGAAPLVSAAAAASVSAALPGGHGGAAGPAAAAAPAAPTRSPAPAVQGASGSGPALARLLAGALLTSDPANAARSDPGQATLLDALGKAGLITVDGDMSGRATEAVLLVPAVAPAGGQGPSPSPSPDPLPQWSALAAALDAAGDGSVVTGPASSATTGGVVAAIRGQDPLAASISTVDTGGTPMGDVTTVLALREQEFGGAGRYGFVGKVDAPLPPRPGAGKP